MTWQGLNSKRNDRLEFNYFTFIKKSTNLMKLNNYKNIPPSLETCFSKYVGGAQAHKHH